jgi:hypothetical protein
MLTDWIAQATNSGTVSCGCVSVEDRKEITFDLDSAKFVFDSYVAEFDVSRLLVVRVSREWLKA